MTNDDKALVERLRSGRWLGETTCGPAADRIEALSAENEQLREELAAAYVKLSGKSIHASDCATSNAPAMEPGPCNCDAVGEQQ